MNPDGFRRVQEAFDRVLRLPARERLAAVDSAFPGEEELRHELAVMIQGHGSSADFLRPPGADTKPGPGAGADRTRTGPVIPR